MLYTKTVYIFTVYTVDGWMFLALYMGHTKTVDSICTIKPELFLLSACPDMVISVAPSLTGVYH